MTSGFLGEFFGTLTLILLGNGVVAGCLLKKSIAEGSGWLVITTAWGFAVTFGVIVALVLGSGGHLNPAITIGVGIATGDWSQAPTYIAAQFAGAIVGATLDWLHYFPHWAETEDAAAKRACFCTAPAIRKIPANLLAEIIGTFVLVFIAAAIFSGRLAADGLTPGMGPFLVGLLVWGIGLSLGGPTGYAINPARDLGPRIAHALLPIAGKGSSGWDYAAVPVAGPVIGAILGGLAEAAFGI
jgi:glycerol uptake facilitator protein